MTKRRPKSLRMVLIEAILSELCKAFKRADPFIMCAMNAFLPTVQSFGIGLFGDLQKINLHCPDGA